MITSGITIGINKQDGTSMNIAIDPVNTNKTESGTANTGTYKLYRDIDSAKTFDKGYLGAISLDGADNSYHYSGGTELTDFELKQLADFIRGYHATGKELDDHNRDITTK
ncbi:hypothetical protein SAMN05421821_104274 [Mucilaginibacter lappiensis]|uniref:Uncharacterized protein n=1 Tax=Mucilaginibacter lappiensis TaxID=354630 RepID=A0ABR6PHS0_9SPHI|nr:hypothetical protein [Mucilaginibacter lappiensis]MBB6109314.1 hypothetical protein [Mucilaginibacter lappiensis]SIR00505.1 hypothetical protein SAMN05421821_104274 [Mucilaginibacter lappiensis]